MLNHGPAGTGASTAGEPGYHTAADPTGTRLAYPMAMKTTALSPIEKLLELYYQPLFRFATLLSGNPTNAMLLTQRTFRLAFDFSRTLPVPTNVRAWLFAILFNKFLEDRLQGSRI